MSMLPLIKQRTKRRGSRISPETARSMFNTASHAMTDDGTALNAIRMLGKAILEEEKKDQSIDGFKVVFGLTSRKLFKASTRLAIQFQKLLGAAS
jgi:hypothetical protein